MNDRVSEKEYRRFWFGKDKRDVFSHSAQCDEFFSTLAEDMTADVSEHLGCSCWCHYTIPVETEVCNDDGASY